MPRTLSPDALHSRFCANVRAQRDRLGLTQADVADRLEIAPPSYTAIESGRRMPTLATVARVAGALCVDPASLLGARNGRRAAAAGSA